MKLVSEIQRETSCGRVVNSRPNCRGAHRHRIGLLRNEAREKIVLERPSQMRRSISARRKRGGRPATGHDPMVGLRISKETRAAIKKWASTQHDHPNFSEAVRRLIEIGLKSLDEFE
jgi:hypothetical protein